MQHAGYDEWTDFLLAPATQKYSSLAQYLETYYSLLRAECFIPLGIGVKQLTSRDNPEVRVLETVQPSVYFVTVGSDPDCVAFDSSGSRNVDRCGYVLLN